MKLEVLRTTVAIALASCVALSGCSRKEAECDKFVTVINDNGKNIKASSSKLTGKGDESKTYDEVANVLDAAADNIKSVALTDAKLQEFAKEYEGMLRGGAQSARAVVKAQADSDADALTRAMEGFASAHTTEAAVVARINGYCAAD